MAARIVQCPVCRTQLHEPPGVPLFSCVCGTVLQSSSAPAPPPPQPNGNYHPHPPERFSSFGSERPPSSGSSHPDPPDMSGLSLHEQRPSSSTSNPPGGAFGRAPSTKYHQCTHCGGFLHLPDNLPRDKNGNRLVRCGSCQSVNRFPDPEPESPGPAALPPGRKPFAYEQNQESSVNASPPSSIGQSAEQAGLASGDPPGGYSGYPPPAQPPASSYPPPPSPPPASYPPPPASPPANSYSPTPVAPPTNSYSPTPPPPPANNYSPVLAPPPERRTSSPSFQSSPSPPQSGGYQYQASLPTYQTQASLPAPHLAPPPFHPQYSLPPTHHDAGPYGVGQPGAYPGDMAPPGVAPVEKKKRRSFFGKLKKTFEDEDEFERDVKVNGFPVPDAQVKKAEPRSGPIQPGDYWYDVRAGFWGIMDGPCLGIIPAGIRELVRNKKSEEQGGSGVNELQRHFSGGTTGVVINGRELAPRDLTVLKSRGLSDEPRSYWLDITGQLTDAVTNQPLMQLGHLAMSLAQGQAGLGMRIPEEELRRRKLEEVRKALQEQQNVKPIVARV